MLSANLAPGYTGTLLCHVMPWFQKAPGGNYHPNTSYNSNDPLTIGKQLTVMQRCAVGGVILTYQGPLATFQHQTAVEMSKQCSERGMLFALLMDPWSAKLGTGTPEQKMTAVLNNPDVLNMLRAPSYLPEGALLDFNTNVDWTKVSVPVLGSGKPRPIWKENIGFSWPQIVQDPVAALKAQNANPGMMVPGLCMSFFDGGMPRSKQMQPPCSVDVMSGQLLDFNQQDWGTEAAPAGVSRYLNDRAGNYFWDQVAVTPFTKPYLALVTWNDYSERTAWEPWCSVMAGMRIS